MYPPQAVALFVVSTIFPSLSIIAVALRVYSRRLTRSSLSASDYWIFFTLLNAILNAIACIIGAAACGIGLPLADLSAQIESRFLKILFVTQFFYVTSVWSVKVSVLYFYKSIFTTNDSFTRLVNRTLIVLAAWIIAFFFVTLFQDKPIQRNWGTVGTTINWRIFYIIEIASDVALDIFILCLPLVQIRALHMSGRRKWALAGVFWLGGFVVIASTVRLAYMIIVRKQFQVEDDDFSFTTVDTIIWGSIEPCTSVVAACLPVMSPILFKRQRAARERRQNTLSSFFRSTRRNLIYGSRRHQRLGLSDTLVETNVTTGDEVPSSATDSSIKVPDKVFVSHSFHIDSSI